jgi:hypothetical protein
MSPTMPFRHVRQARIGMAVVTDPSHARARGILRCRSAIPAAKVIQAVTAAVWKPNPHGHWH